jgi:hypothetical protein
VNDQETDFVPDAVAAAGELTVSPPQRAAR